ncbi:MAG TPA: gamma-glutamyl-gamma-aminobutyrate hydrolase family protein [Planctomycetota bacterium]|jgi:putative glutamine amidotransferase|nr:gamma-glutamyl-gamma-aminobutyrate hydrolase family protein [Planctomycetota bacterium]
MNSPLIGITTYPPDEQDRFHLKADYVHAVRRAGGVVVLIPPGEPRPEDLVDVIDGLLLAGGGDVDPGLYGGAAHETIANVNAERDASEIALARRVVETGVPLLGVCRGAQILNVALGGTLVEHLPDVVGDSVPHRTPDRQPTRHPVSVEQGSRLAGVLGATEINPTSLHHQAIRRLGSSLRVVARAPDGTIEAVESSEHPWLIGIQFHCEIRSGVDPTEQRVFDELVRAAARRKASRTREREA